MSDLVESAIALDQALRRVRYAHTASLHHLFREDDYYTPSPKIAAELLEASEAVRAAVVALTGALPPGSPDLHLYDTVTGEDLGPATKAQVAAGKLSTDLEEGRKTWVGDPNVVAGTRGQFVVDRDGDLVNYGLMMTYEPGWHCVFVAEAGWKP